MAAFGEEYKTKPISEWDVCDYTYWLWDKADSIAWNGGDLDIARVLVSLGNELVHQALKEKGWWYAES